MKKNLKFAFIQTFPVFLGYLFLGIAFGLLLQREGYNYLWALFMSIFVFAGSMQFVLVGVLGSHLNIFSVILLTLTINSRHIFYGLSFIDTFKKMGRAYPYMIFSLTDETYSLLCGTKVPENLDRKHVFFLMALLDHSYWVMGSLIGSLLGEFIRFNSTGTDFAMTALFVVIFIEQWLSSKAHIPAVLGLIAAVISLFVFGPKQFILPAILGTIGILLLFKKKLHIKEEALIHDPFI